MPTGAPGRWAFDGPTWSRSTCRWCPRPWWPCWPCADRRHPQRHFCRVLLQSAIAIRNNYAGAETPYQVSAELEESKINKHQKGGAHSQGEPPAGEKRAPSRGLQRRRAVAGRTRPVGGRLHGRGPGGWPPAPLRLIKRRCSCSTPAVSTASPRALSTPPPVTTSTPRKPCNGCSTSGDEDIFRRTAHIGWTHRAQARGHGPLAAGTPVSTYERCAPTVLPIPVGGR